MSIRRRLTFWFLVLFPLIVPAALFGQAETATLSGRISDPQGSSVPKAKVEIVNIDTNVASTTFTNEEGIYVFTGIRPGRYRLLVLKDGFHEIIKPEFVLNVQDHLEQNFGLQIGSVSETVTVEAGGLNINTTDAAVSTIVDRKFVENMPLNGRSLQSLLTLSPGVGAVTAVGGTGFSGEISVNGQRTEANYFTVDGVSANTGSYAGDSVGSAAFAGSLPSQTVLGTTQSMISIDALEEFRASTSTYSAEYGRTPGGQFSFSTRAGTNTWHGSAFDYFRNDVLDANNWFNNAAAPQVPRQPERQNDFGGTLGGPVIIPGLYSGKDKTFFFFSYEGLRLIVPQPFQQFFVPDSALRQQAPSPLQPFLDAFPIPNGGEDGLNDGQAFYNLVYSTPSSLDNVGIRVDHSFGERFKFFGRYANTPSSSWNFNNVGPSFKQSSAVNIRSLTVGVASSITPLQMNEFRFNFTRNETHFSNTSTSYGGATPLSIGTLAAPNGQPATALGTGLAFVITWGGQPNYNLEESEETRRQINVTDNYSWSHAAHQFKFGIDWRSLTTYVRPITNYQFAVFESEASLLANSTDVALVFSNTSMPFEPVYHNFSVFVQDEWKAASRLSVSLGLRWDVNPAPGNLIGPTPYTLDQITDLNTSKLARQNTPLWNTDWHGFAPRVGMAYQFRQPAGRELVLRAGFGVFYDLGNILGSQGFASGVGFTSQNQFSGVPFPLTSAQVTLPAPSVTSPYDAQVYAFDPNLKLPYTMQWNLTLEQGLGADQSLSAGYVGSTGRRLLTTLLYFPVSNPNFSSGNGLYLTSNQGSSDYSSVQVKYRKRLTYGLQALASYTFSHSIDDLSSNFNSLVSLRRASSDFDIRHNFQAAITYDIPGTYSNPLVSAVLRHWGLDTRISVRSALPVDVVGKLSVNSATGQDERYHPDIVPGQPIYLYGSKYPGGRIINFNAFTRTPAGVDGNVGRNFARGFSAAQADVALRRDFPINERLHLQFRTEAFNVFNHAIFGSIYNQLSYGQSLFGHAYQTLNNSGYGGLNSLYQVGGPRSLQLSLKLNF